MRDAVGLAAAGAVTDLGVMSVAAIGLFRFGGPEVLGMVEVPRREPGPRQARVSVRAFSVNPTDTLFREGLTRVSSDGSVTWPAVPGWDLSGVVESTGSRSRWSAGDRVTGLVFPGPATAPGAYASEVIVDDDSLVRMPKGSSYAEASTLLMNGLTAMHGLDLLDLPPGSTIGITGAAGAVGGYAVGLARRRGLRVVGDASASDEKWVLSAGADVVVPRGGDIVQSFVEAAGGQLDGVLDAALIGPSIADAVKDGAGLAVVRPVEWQPARGIARHDVRFPVYLRDAAKLGALRDLVEREVLELRVAQVLGADETSEAHRRLAAGGLRGRLVIEWEPAD